MKQQQIAKLENPDENPTLETIEKVARALGLSVNLELQSTERISVTGLKGLGRALIRANAPAGGEDGIRTRV